MRLKSVSFVKPVFFNGQTVHQVIQQFGDTLEADGPYVKLIPNPSKKRDTVHVPMTNIAQMTIIDPVAERAREEAELLKKLEEDERIRVAATVPPKPLAAKIKGIVKFVKDPDTGEIVEKTV